MTPREQELATAIGANVRAVRSAKGVTQEALAERALTYRENVGRIERGKHLPALRTLLRWADALGVHVSEFVKP